MTLSNHLLLIMAFTISFGSSKAQNREVTLEYRIVSPLQYTEFSAPTDIEVSYLVHNFGPDTLWPCDTVRSKIRNSLLSGEEEIARYFALPNAIYPGDSALLYDTTFAVKLASDTPGQKRIMELELEFGFSMFNYSFPNCRPLEFKFTEYTQYYNSLQLIHVARNTAFIAEPRFALFRVFPNPTEENKVTLAFYDLGFEPKIIVYDLLGKAITVEVNEANGDYIVDFGKASKGVYFINVWLENKLFTQKVILR